VRGLGTLAFEPVQRGRAYGAMPSAEEHVNERARLEFKLGELQSA